MDREWGKPRDLKKSAIQIRLMPLSEWENEVSANCRRPYGEEPAVDSELLRPSVSALGSARKLRRERLAFALALAAARTGDVSSLILGALVFHWRTQAIRGTGAARFERSGLPVARLPQT